MEFKCDVCDHTFTKSVSDVTRGRWCPYCDNKKLCPDSANCDYCLAKTVASHPKGGSWRPDNPKTASQVFLGAGEVYKWTCDNLKCGHVFEKAPKGLKGGNWCPYCCKTNRKICEDETCQICHGVSFAMHPMARIWSNQNEFGPEHYTTASAVKCLFDCDVCFHTFSASLTNISTNGMGCPYCSPNQGKLCTDLTCNHCHNRSQACTKRASRWSKKNPKTARQVTLWAISPKYKFDCELCGKEFEMSPAHISKGYWCSCQKIRQRQNSTHG